ncbi:MAG: CPBP family glutamic-type intramembrane protease [Bacteroidota bacterium]
MSSHAADEIAKSLQEMERLAAPPPGGPDAPRHGAAAYAHATRSATYAFLAALPLLVVYEIGVVLTNTGARQIRVGADAWMKQALASLGVQGGLLLSAVVVVIGGVVFWMERERRPPIRASYFGWIVVESLVYAFVLAMIVTAMVGALFGAVSLWPLAMAQMSQLSLPLQLSLSIGAGLYEELVFRVMLVGGLFLALRQVVKDRRVAYIVAAVVGALVFSWVHYVGSLGDPFTLSSFTYRFLFGLALNGVFLLRGFAVAAWTHALYDVLVVTGSL